MTSFYSLNISVLILYFSVFPINKVILLHNYCSVNKIGKITLIKSYSNFTSCPDIILLLGYKSLFLAGTLGRCFMTLKKKKTLNTILECKWFEKGRDFMRPFLTTFAINELWGLLLGSLFSGPNWNERISGSAEQHGARTCMLTDVFHLKLE